MTKCKLFQIETYLFAITLSRNPIISLQSVSLDKIVYEHRNLSHNKKSAEA